MKIAITTGDPDGIGFEVTAKALARIKSNRKVEYIVFGSPFKSEKWQKLIRTHHPKANFELRSANESPAQWVREAAQKCMTGEFDALVTGPMSKNPTGHTEILQSIAEAEHVFMAFLGSKFHVILATGHLPLSKVASAVSTKTLLSALGEAKNLHRRLKLKKPIAVLALNPHAGERGLLGDEEILIQEALSRFKGIHGPLVPDAAFTPRNQKMYSVFVAQYHDQGLIPFKAVHGFSEGTNMTLGIPFLRTSVDHGTAKDIFNKNKADPGSMISAICWARRLLV